MTGANTGPVFGPRCCLSTVRDIESSVCKSPSSHFFRKTIMSDQLTQRETEVVRLISLGCTVKEAAAILRLAPSTVDNHKSRAMKKMGTDKLALVTRLALKMRISST